MKQYTRIINFEDIKISYDFLSSTPNQQKLDICRDRYMDAGILDRDLVLTESLILVDGYVGYLVLKEAGYKGPVLGHIIEGSKSETYVYGKHLGSDKEYAWLLPKNTHTHDAAPGDLILVDTVRGIQPIIITAIEKGYCSPKNEGLKSVTIQRSLNGNHIIKLYSEDDSTLYLNDYDTYYIVAETEGDAFFTEARYCSVLDPIAPEYQGNKKSGFYQYDEGWGYIVFENVIGASIKIGEII